MCAQVLMYNHDVLGALSLDELSTRLGLGDLDDRLLWVQQISLASGEGLVEGFEWLEVRLTLAVDGGDGDGGGGDGDGGDDGDGDGDGGDGGGEGESRAEELTKDMSASELAAYSADLEELIAGMPALGLDASPKRAPQRKGGKDGKDGGGSGSKSPRAARPRRPEPSLDLEARSDLFEPGSVGKVVMERD